MENNSRYIIEIRQVIEQHVYYEITGDNIHTSILYTSIHVQMFLKFLEITEHNGYFCCDLSV
jgi:hypothetical protein